MLPAWFLSILHSGKCIRMLFRRCQPNRLALFATASIRQILTGLQAPPGETRNLPWDLAHRLQIVFLGKWTPEFEVLVAQKGLDELVKFMHYRPHREALAIAKDFDALALAVDSRQSGSRALTPGRIYEYLALKKPILAMCPPESEVAEIVQLTHAGEAVEYHNRERIAATLQKWLKNRDALPNIFTFRNIEQFNRKVQSEAFWQFIGEICR